MGQIIAVSNPKGGVGKTTVAIHIAKFFQLAGQRVVIIDADPLAASQVWANQQPKHSSPIPCFGLLYEGFENSIKDIIGTYDLVVIDSAAQLQANLIAPVLKVARLVIIPIQPSALDIWGTSELSDLVASRAEIIPGFDGAFLINRQIQGTALARDVVESLQELRLPVLKARLSQRVAYVEAIAAGETVLEYEPRGKAAVEVTDLGKELMKLMD